MPALSKPDSPRAIKKLLIANRGEIAVRIARTAADMGIQTVAIYSEDDNASGHLRRADSTHALAGNGAAAYLDIEQIVAAALEHNCDAIHPGYGFLSENSTFAQRCVEAKLIFVGPAAATIAMLGNKTEAREIAQRCGVAVANGSPQAVTLDEAKAFFSTPESGGAIMLKAIAGGGGKGMRIVRNAAELEAAYLRCQNEARRAFGNDEIYIERLIENARHIEVQIISDGETISHLWERECTLQRQHQKLVEIAPSPSLNHDQRHRIIESALRLAKACHYSNIGTFEFLLDLDRREGENDILFLEVNPRLQVEHTVTEEVLGLDLVQIQLALASGMTVSELSLDQASIPAPRGQALQLRVNMETMDTDGRALPASGHIGRFVLPSGPGIRVDTFAYEGYKTVASFDSLIAKLIISTHSADLGALINRAQRAVSEFEINGVETNLAFINMLLSHPAVRSNSINTRFIEAHIAELLPTDNKQAMAPDSVLADGCLAISAPLQGIISSVLIKSGDAVVAGTELVLIEAMKLEHEIKAPCDGIVADVIIRGGDSIQPGQAMLYISPGNIDTNSLTESAQLDLNAIREDLQQLQERVGETLDENRPKAVERRRARGQRTARENIAELCDPDSFIEYGQLTVAYLHARKSDEELRATTPADGFVMGIATVNAELFGDAANVAVGSYDATVMAGTQGHKNHQKTDRLFDLAREQAIPLVLFAEGGGGRPREDPVTIAALQNECFRKLAQLSGHVPVVGIVAGRCFAGNAALLGMADVIIATEDSNIGMAGPALIEAGGLGSFTPEAIGPIDVQTHNGVVDIRVKDEAEAVHVCRRYLSYFQGTVTQWEAADPRLLRHVIPENRLRAYDVRDVIPLLADTDSVLELRAAYGQAYVTTLIRIEGRAMGVIANNPKFNSGAIDSDSADKAARFMRLCDAHDLPILSLIDTPGIMVGPEAEKTGLVRHSARLFVTAASLSVPMFAIVLRKAYGLGAMAAAGGHFRAPVFTVAWPTGELGGMGLEGGVQLAYKKELDAIEDPAERQAFFEERVASRYRKGKATYIASYFELDAVIDPAESRKWIMRGLASSKERMKPAQTRFIDTW